MADEFFSTNSLVRQYRKVLEASGKVDDRTDLQLTIELGNKLRSSGDFETENKFPDFKEQYLNAIQSTDRSLTEEIGQGIKRGATGLAATGLGALALGADLIGAKETASGLAKKARSLDSGEDSAPTVSRVGDVRDVGEGVRYAAGKAGEVIPSIAESILTAMIGAAAGSTAGPEGTVAGGIAGLVGRRAVKQLIRDGVAKKLLGREVTETALETALRAGENKLLQAEFVGTAKNLAARMGGEATSALNSLALSSGEIYNSTEDKGLALGAGAVAALPDSILPAYVVRKFFPTGTVTKEAAAEASGYMRRLLTEVPKTIPLEAGTETFQELVSIAAEKYKAGAPLTLTTSDLDRLKEAGIGGVAGGAIAAPIAAAPDGGRPMPTPVAPTTPATSRLSAEDVRRRVSLGQQPRVAPTGVQAAVLMNPEQQRIRLDALEKISTRSRAEEGELEVLRAALGVPAKAPAVTPAPSAVTIIDRNSGGRFKDAKGAIDAPAFADDLVATVDAALKAGKKVTLIADSGAKQVPITSIAQGMMQDAQGQRWGTIGILSNPKERIEITSSPAPVVTAQTATPVPAAPSPTVVSPPVQDVVPPGTPLVATPSAAPAPVAATPIQLGQRVQTVGKRLLQVVNQVPSLDISAVQDQLKAISAAGKVSSDDVAALETSLGLIEQQAGVESAARTANKLAKTKATGEAKAKAADIRLTKQSEKAATALQKLVDAASAKAETVAPLTAPEATPDPAKPDLTQRLQAALNPSSPVARTTPFTFGKVTFQSADLRPALTQGADGAARPLTSDALKEVNWEKTIDVTGALGDSGDRSKTRIAVALMAPDGRVLLRGLSNYNKAEGLKRVGAKAGAATGPAVQGMGLLKGKLKESKIVDPEGKQQVLLNDVVAAGYIPIARVNFEAEPGSIREDFATSEEFDQAWNSTEKVGKAVAVSEAANRQSLPTQVFSQGDDAIAAAESQQAGNATAAPTLAASAQRTAEDAQFESQKAAPKVVTRKVTKQLLADTEKALGKKRMKELSAATLGQPLTERTRIISNELETNPKLAGLADETLVEAALHRIFKPATPDRVQSKERRPRKGGSGGGDVSLRTGLALPNTGKIDSKFFERLHQNITRQGGVFNEEFLVAIGSANQDRIGKLLEMTGLDWPEFMSRVQAAFEGTGNDAEFAAQLKGELPRLETPSNRTAWQAIESRNLQRVIDRLKNAGVNVEIVAQEVLAKTPGRVGSYDPALRNVRLAIEDVANANLGNMLTLIHEVGHDVLRSAHPDIQERLHRAAERVLPDVTTAQATNPEEQLVESFAVRLTEEGFGDQAPSMAQAIIRGIKDLYLRVAMAVQTALNREPSDALALAWFENNLRRLVGGDFDYRFTDIFRTLLPEKVADTVRRFTWIDGPGVANFLDPLTRSLRQPVALPDTVEAAEYNLLYRDTPVIGDEESGMDYTESMARVQAAGWNEILPVLAQLKKDLGSKLTDIQFWKLFARGDMPSDIVKRLEERVAGSSKAMIAGENMTEPMNQRARYNAFRLANILSVQARRRAASKSESAAKAANDIVAAARRLNKIEREFRDVDEMNAMFNQSLREMLKEFATDIDRGNNTAFAAGKLLGAVREMENLTEEQAIPDEYQRVFKQLLDADSNSVFEYLSAIAKLDLPLGRMTVAEIAETIKTNATGDAKLRDLVKQRPLMLALASLARQSTNEMDMLQLRVMKDTTTYLAIKADLDEIRTANDEHLANLTEAWKIAQGNQGLRDRLRKGFIDARKEFRTKQRVIQRAEENGMIAREVADRLAQKATDLSRDVGAFSFWEPANGTKYKALSKDDKGNWFAVDRTLKMVGSDVSEQFEQVRHDLRYNNLWLEEHKSEAGSRLFEEVKRQTHELSLLDIGKQSQAAHRFWLDKMLQPIGQKFAGTGTASGGRVQQMLNRFQFISRTHADEVEAKSHKWTKALQEAAESAGYVYYKQFFQDVYDQVIYQVESQPGLDEAAALREAVRAAKRRIPANFTLAENFPEKLAALLRQTKDMSESLNRIAEQNGVYIEDKRIRDPLTQKANLHRHAIKYGWLTSTRKLRAKLIQTLVENMQKAGWTDTMFEEIVAPGEMDDTQWQEVVDHYFTPTVVRDFVQPFVNKPGKEVFFGAGDKNISQLEAQQAWEESEGNVLKFIDTMYAMTAGEQDVQADYRKAMLQRFASLYKMESKIAAESSVVKNIYDPHGPKAHRLMDGRTNDLIPPEHFEYDVFDPASARIALGEISFHSSFGRNGTGLDATLADLKSDLSEKNRRYDMLPTGSRKLKREAAEARGWNFTELERASRDFNRIDGWMNEVGTYFGGGNQGGAVGDAKALLELMSLNMSLVLNQPKSGLWNILSLADFPIAFRGLGKTSLKASAWALQNLVRNVFGSGLESMGINLLRAGEYGQEIGEVFDGRKSERLPWGVAIADIGKGGQFQEGGAGERTVQAVRGIQQTLKKGFKLGPGQGQFAGFNALWAPFNFINQQVASSIATANVQAFEMIVRRGIDYFARHPEAERDPAFRFNAELLGMKGKTWFSDEGAFDFFRDKAADYRLGSIEDVVRQSARSQAEGKRLLTRDQALGVAMMAMNEISLESSINSRPVEMFNNPVLRLGGLMLGWPLAKMNQVNQSLKTKDGQVEAMAMLKGLGVLAAWVLPVGLAYSLMMDHYDEKILGKKSNLRGIDGIAAVPLIGPLLAAAGVGERSGKDNILGMLERSARAGNVYGLGADAINSLGNIVDPTSGQRDFSLDSRVLIFSQFANLRDAVRNFVQTDGAATYQTVGRPILATLGGNGLLQYQQIANQLFELDNNEARVTARTNVGNWLRAAGRETGVELRAGAGRSSVTPTSVWVREMQLASYGNDRMGFLEAYRNAVEAARKQGDEDPEKKVLESWKSRDPLGAVFRQKPSETDMAKMLAVMDDDGKRAVREALTLYDEFTEMIAPNRTAQLVQRRIEHGIKANSGQSLEQIRRKIAQQSLGF